jgi:SAM domain (Sterile alpha motif)
MDLGRWLRSLGLDRYEAAFRANAIDADVLCDLTDQDLEKLGVLLGHRRKILRAIAAIGDTLAPATAPQAMPLANAPDQRTTAGALETHFEGPAFVECGHVTVMFCGLIDPSGSPHAEEWHGLVDAFLHAASIAVTEWNGTVADKLDDGFIAFFAYPVTQEDDLERAVHAARAIQRSVAELNRRNGGSPTLAARIVIESGPTTVDGDSDVFGELRSVAATAQIATQQRQIPSAKERDSHQRQGRRVELNRTINDGRPISYHQLIARAVDGLDKNTGEARRALYERARNALVAQLGSNQPVLVLADITKERLALEEAIRKVEAEAARNLRRESRTATHDLRSAGAVGRTVDVGGQSAPPRRDPPNPSGADLPRAESDQVLVRARNRLLRVNAPETLPHQAAQQPVPFSREAHLNDLNSNVYDIQQQRGDDSADEPENGRVVPPQHTRSAPGKQIDRERRWQSPNAGPPSLPGANWSLRLPRPLIVSGLMTVVTLNDARVLIERHLQGEARAKKMWRYVSKELREAVLADDMAEFSSVLEMALSLEGLEWELK